LGLGFRLTTLLWREQCGYLLIKKSFAISNGFLKEKNGLIVWWTSQNGKYYTNSHSKFVIGTQYMMYYKMINSNKELFFWKP
jgi:hypothetical protein